MVTPQPSAPTLVAEIARVRFYADDSGFTIAAATDGNGHTHTIKGTFTTMPTIGATYAFYGAWINDPSYGKQLDVQQMRTMLPQDAEGIMCYLDENASFIGPATARALVERFGADTLQILKDSPADVAGVRGVTEDTPNALPRIPGMTLERAERISNDLRANEAAEQIEIALASLLAPCGIGPALRRRIARHEFKRQHGDTQPASVIDYIRANPYVLTRIEGIGFKKADMVARKLGLAPDDPRRVHAGIVYVLDEMTRRDGHVRIPSHALKTQAAATLMVDTAHVTNGMNVMIAEGKLIATIVGTVNDGKLIATDDSQVYLPSAYKDEQYNAEKLRDLLPVDGKRVSIARHVSVGEKIDSFVVGLADDQLRALDLCAQSGVFILTGAPGTGKTFTIKRIIDTFPSANTRLCAPTGKAAKRMTEMAGGAHEAVTIHRLLGPVKNPATGRFDFQHNVYNKLPADIVIVDEFSMVDNWLCARLLEALSLDTRLIIVGDHYQLPSVGSGNVLRDIIASGAVPTVELTTIKRQNPGYIVQSCHSIKSGGDIVSAGGVGTADLQFVEVAGGEHAIAERVVHLVGMFRRTGWEPMRQVQVITALREKTALACAPLNSRLQHLLNGAAPKTPDTLFRPGDKVIQTRNDYERDIVNGDIGYVDSIYTSGPKRNKIVVNFENPRRQVMVSLRANALELAYAVTCHKYQGSETDVVIVPVHSCLGNVVVQRSWLYTAISRAKQCCVLVGERAQIARIVERTRSQERWTGLVEALREVSK